MPETLVEVLAHQAACQSERVAFSFLRADGRDGGHLTYGALRAAVLAQAAALQAAYPPGSVVLIVLPTGPAAVVSFLAAIHAGLVPSLLRPPGHRHDRRALDRLTHAVHRTNARALLLSTEAAALVGPMTLERQELDPDAVPADASATAWRPVSPDPATPAFLQFTSGSTGAPRGAVISHRAALANCAQIGRAFGHDETLNGLGWLPLHHDMGLVGHVLHPLWIGGTSTLAPTEWFSRDPLAWLALLSERRITTSGGPPFAYARCVRQAERLPAGLDLSAWRVAYVGAEPVSAAGLDRFAAAFAPYGFRRAALLPCYGLAEATLYVAGAPLGAPQDPVRYPLPSDGISVRIDGERAGEGEILVSGPSVADGYIGDAFASAQTFQADGDGRVWLHTGDLGRLESGALVVTGRRKDLIIIRGDNHHATDLEDCVCASQPALHDATVACFAVPGEDTEQLVVAIESRSGDMAMVREALASGHGVQPAEIIALRPGALPRSASGKLSRADCRAAYLAGRLGPAAPRSATCEPVAVIGMACRFPGADDPKDFWSLLMAGGDAVREVPAERWAINDYFDARPAVPGRMNTRCGGFIEGIDRFDAAFFGIAPQEAAEMDPQQRLLLEVAWRAFEDAGLTLDRLSGSSTGVFVGLSTTDYQQLQIRQRPGLELYNAYSGLGNAFSIAANRLSYLFNLHGPSIAVDTACSSSLTALHQAVRAVRAGECRVALAGGVNAMLSPGTTVTLSQFGMMAPDGRCKVFDADADGYVRAEGCGLLVLKRLADAQADGDRVLAVIRGSAINHDGRSPGITAPNPAAQLQVMRAALADAGCAAETVGLVEAHGTGTAIGDPAEMACIHTIYGTTGSTPCQVGAVKANIGHLEAAAGIAGVIKSILALRHRQIPPQIHLHALNPGIRLEGSRLAIPRVATPWSTGPRLAAVSSFGFGGANAHVILAEAEPFPAAPPRPGPWLFPLSAKTEPALRDFARSLEDWLDGPDGDPAALSATVTLRRDPFPWRAAVVADSVTDLRQGLRVLQPVLAGGAEKMALLFSGQGTQRPGMGRGLYRRYGVWRAAFDRCAAAFAAVRPEAPPLAEVVFAADGILLERADLLQPALFAVDVACGLLWRSFGVEPAAVLGHSLGEFAAACLAGCFSLEDGMALVAGRARLMAGLPRKGAMLAVAFGAEQAAEFLGDFPELSLAAINGRDSVVLSGPEEHILAALPRLPVAGGRLRTPLAFHSALMEPILDAFTELAATVAAEPPRLPLISNLTGAVMTRAPDALYWRNHLRQPVRFLDGLQSLIAHGIGHVVEAGPGDTLASLAARLPGFNLTLSSMTGADDDGATLLRSAGRLYEAGLTLHGPSVFDGTEPPPAETVPGHPFQRSRYWFAGGADSPAAPAFPFAEWVYGLRWSPLPIGRSAASDETGWIVVGDGRGLGSALTLRLTQPGRDVFHLAQPDDAATGLAALLGVVNGQAKATTTRWRLLYVGAIDSSLPDDRERLEQDQRRFGPGALTAVAQAVVRSAAAIQVWLVTAGAEAVTADQPLDVGQATTWGFGHTWFLEHPEHRGGLIDLDPSQPAAAQGTEVLAGVLADDGERWAAFRAGRRHVARLVPEPPATRPDFPGFRRTGSYLITGGLGGLGLECAQWLARGGAGHIVLLSRRGLTGDDHTARQAITAAEQAGAIVTVVKGDVTDAAAMTRLLGELDASDRPLAGVLHAAGVNWFARVTELDPVRLLDTLKTKVSAAWTLHRLTQGRDLDCFILFSSVSALWGSVDLSHYSAANRFLDALAIQRHRQGDRALSIAWGPWANVGMSAHDQEVSTLTRLGFRLMLPRRALQVMEGLLTLGTPHAVVTDTNWPQYRPFISFSTNPAFFSQVSAEAAALKRQQQAGTATADRLRTLGEDEARGELRDLVRQALAGVLLADPARMADDRQRFNLMGMDSLMAIAFALSLESVAGCKLPTALAYNYPTVADVADHLFALIRSSAHALAATATASAPSGRWFPVPGEAAQRLYCFPPAGAGASAFARWDLGSDWTIIPAQLPGREVRVGEPAPHDLPALVTSLADAVQDGGDTPFALFGHSLGGRIAFAVAAELGRRGAARPRMLILSGCGLPEDGDETLAGLPEPLLRQQAIHMLDLAPEVVQDDRLWQDLFPVLRGDLALYEGWRPDAEPLPDVPLLLLAGMADRVASRRRLLAWSALTTGEVALRQFPGGHRFPVTCQEAVITAIRDGLAGLKGGHLP